MAIAFPKKMFTAELLAPNGRTRQIVSSGLTRIGKRFKRKTQVAMETATHTGRTYPRRGSTGFTRLHLASARFERPAPDTGNLVRAVVDSKVDYKTHEVLVDDGKAPYGKFLVGGLDRVIMSQEDVDQFADGEMQVEVERMHEELLKG